MLVDKCSLYRHRFPSTALCPRTSISATITKTRRVNRGRHGRQRGRVTTAQWTERWTDKPGDILTGSIPRRDNGFLPFTPPPSTTHTHTPQSTFSSDSHCVGAAPVYKGMNRDLCAQSNPQALAAIALFRKENTAHIGSNGQP